jgi:hypothetical protein
MIKNLLDLKKKIKKQGPFFVGAAVAGIFSILLVFWLLGFLVARLGEVFSPEAATNPSVEFDIKGYEELNLGR